MSQKVALNSGYLTGFFLTRIMEKRLHFLGGNGTEFYP